MGTLGAVRFFSAPQLLPASLPILPFPTGLSNLTLPWSISRGFLGTLSECLFFFGIYSFHSGGILEGIYCLPIFGGGNAILSTLQKKGTSNNNDLRARHTMAQAGKGRRNPSIPHMQPRNFLTGANGKPPQTFLTWYPGIIKSPHKPPRPPPRKFRHQRCPVCRPSRVGHAPENGALPPPPKKPRQNVATRFRSSGETPTVS